MDESELNSEEELNIEHKEDKSIIEKPLGKLFITLITVYSFVFAILALAYNKDIFIFLPATTVIIGINCFTIFYAVVKANLTYYDENTLSKTSSKILKLIKEHSQMSANEIFEDSKTGKIKGSLLHELVSLYEKKIIKRVYIEPE